MLESKFKLKERQFFEARGWKFITLDPGAGVPKGFPDTLCIAPNGYSCYVEWKKNKNAKRQGLQEYWNGWLNRREHDASFVYPENVDIWREEVMRKGGQYG